MNCCAPLEDDLVALARSCTRYAAAYQLYFLIIRLLVDVWFVAHLVKWKAVAIVLIGKGARACLLRIQHVSKVHYVPVIRIRGDGWIFDHRDLAAGWLLLRVIIGSLQRRRHFWRSYSFLGASSVQGSTVGGAFNHSFVGRSQRGERVDLVWGIATDRVVVRFEQGAVFVLWNDFAFIWMAEVWEQMVVLRPKGGTCVLRLWMYVIPTNFWGRKVLYVWGALGIGVGCDGGAGSRGFASHLLEFEAFLFYKWCAIEVEATVLASSFVRGTYQMNVLGVIPLVGQQAATLLVWLLRWLVQLGADCVQRRTVLARARVWLAIDIYSIFWWNRILRLRPTNQIDLFSDGLILDIRILDAIRTDDIDIFMILNPLYILLIWQILKWFLRLLTIFGDFGNFPIDKSFIVIGIDFLQMSILIKLIVFDHQIGLTIDFGNSLAILLKVLIGKRLRQHRLWFQLSDFIITMFIVDSCWSNLFIYIIHFNL